MNIRDARKLLEQRVLGHVGGLGFEVSTIEDDMLARATGFKLTKILLTRRDFETHELVKDFYGINSRFRYITELIPEIDLETAYYLIRRDRFGKDIEEIKEELRSGRKDRKDIITSIFLDRERS